MTKEQFLYALRMRLSQLPESEIQKSLSYYDEMISDLMDDGMTEYEAVAHIGDVGEVAEQILSEQPLSTLIKTKVKPRRGWTPLAIVIAVIGSPIWLSILIALCAVGIALYVTMIAIAVTVFAVVLALIATGLALIIGAFLSFSPSVGGILALVGGGIAVIGLGVLAFIAAKYIVKGLVLLTKSIGRWVKSLFIKREEVQ